MENIEKLRDKLYELIIKKDSLNDDEIIRVSQDLDKLITSYYLTEKTNKDI